MEMIEVYQEVDFEILKKELSEFLDRFAKQEIELEPTAFEVADCLEERARNGESEFWELSPSCSKSGTPQHFHPTSEVWANQIKWQIGFDSKDIAFGLEIFDSESEAEERGFEAEKEGKTGITLTKFCDSSAIDTWYLENGEWNGRYK
tara:strand:- start:94 stop:537 length:444 start_codon:yes stop_codon:yes gene_type:complete